MRTIIPLTMPRWGLTMEEGTVTEWLAAPGDTVGQGTEVLEIETTKLAGVVESPASGLLRRQVAQVGDVLACGALLGVLADDTVSEDEIDVFVSAFEVVAPADEEDAEAGPQTLDVGGRSISYLRKGSGDPVLLIHGFGGNAAGWAFIQDALASEFDTVALDLPGHGASSKQVDDGSLAGQAAFVSEFMGKAGIGKAHIIAHSMGGGIALALAATKPELVDAMVLIAPMGLGEQINGDYLTGFIAAEKHRDIGKVLGALFSDPNLVNRQMIDEIQRYKRVDGVQAALVEISSAIAPGGRQSADLSSVLSDHGGRVAIIWGESDQIIPAVQAPPEYSTIIASAGHMPQAEAAPKVIEIARAAFKG